MTARHAGGSDPPERKRRPGQEAAISENQASSANTNSKTRRPSQRRSRWPSSRRADVAAWPRSLLWGATLSAPDAVRVARAAAPRQPPPDPPLGDDRIYHLRVRRPGDPVEVAIVGRQVEWVSRIERGHRVRCLGCARRFASGSAVTAFALLSWRGELVGAAGVCAACDAKGDMFLLSAAGKQLEPGARVLPVAAMPPIGGSRS